MIVVSPWKEARHAFFFFLIARVASFLSLVYFEKRGAVSRFSYGVQTRHLRAQKRFDDKIKCLLEVQFDDCPPGFYELVEYVTSACAWLLLYAIICKARTD